MKKFVQLSIKANGLERFSLFIIQLSFLLKIQNILCTNVDTSIKDHMKFSSDHELFGDKLNKTKHVENESETSITALVD